MNPNVVKAILKHRPSTSIKTGEMITVYVQWPGPTQGCHFTTFIQ